MFTSKPERCESFLIPINVTVKPSESKESMSVVNKYFLVSPEMRSNISPFGAMSEGRSIIARAKRVIAFSLRLEMDNCEFGSHELKSL